MTGLVLLFIGDEFEAELDALPRADFVIAADQGLVLAERANTRVDLLIGDLDSLSSARVKGAEAGGTTVERHAAEKDKTDLALALDAAVEWGATSVLVVGGGGGRLDHLMANLLLLGAPEYQGVHLQARLGRSKVTVVRGRATLTGEPGTLISLLAVGGPAVVTTGVGLRYRLAGETLEAGSSRGVSNVLVAPSTSVEVTEGVVLAIQPGPEAGSAR